MESHALMVPANNNAGGIVMAITAVGGLMGSSLQRLRRFLSDHRKGVLCVAATGGLAAYLVYRVGRSYRDLREASLHRLRLNGAFDSTQNTWKETVGSLAAKLSAAVFHLVPIPSPQDLRLSLQEPREGQDRYALWNHCKTQTFARLMASVYGTVLLSTFLRVQVNILGRYLYLESLIATDPAARMRIPLEVAIHSETQKRYLAYAEYVLHTGLPLLVTHIQDAAQHVLSGYPLQQKCTFEDVLAIVDAIRQKMEQPLNDSPETILNSYLLPPEQEQQQQQQGERGRSPQRDRKLTMLINETRDALESAEFNQVVSRCLNLGFYSVSQSLHLCFLSTAVPHLETLAPDHDKSAADTADGGPKNLAIPPPSGDGAAQGEQQALLVSMPMAKLMPLVNKQVSKLLSAEPNPFLALMLHDQELSSYAYDLFTGFVAEE